MDVAQIAPTGGGPSRAATGETTYPGRNEVKERVLRKVAEEASSGTIGVDRNAVSVEVTDHRGGYAVRLATPLPIPDLDDTEAVRASTPVLDRVGLLQEQLRGDLAHLLGRDITRLDITVTGAVIPQGRRVK